MIPLVPKSKSLNIDQFFSILHTWENYRDVYKYSSNHLYTKFSSDRQFPIFDFSESADVINSDQSSIKFLIELKEGSQKIPDWIVSVNDLDSSVHYVIITPDKFNAEQLILKNQLSEKLNYSVVWFPYHLYCLTPGDFFAPLYNFCSMDNNKFYNFSKEKEISFLAMSGTNRPERTYFTIKLKKNFGDCSAISYNGQTYGVTEIFEKDFQFPREVHHSSLDSGVRTGNIFSAGGIKQDVGHAVSVDLFDSAYLQIVSETQAGIDTHDNFFVTEKTTKVLFTGMPFVIFGARDYLKNLRELGFMTYESLWSEEYDSLPSWRQRVGAIISLLHKLKEFDWQAALPTLREIHYNNLMVLANRNKIFHNCLLEAENSIAKIIKEHG